MQTKKAKSNQNKKNRAIDISSRRLYRPTDYIDTSIISCGLRDRAPPDRRQDTVASRDTRAQKHTFIGRNNNVSNRNV